MNANYLRRIVFACAVCWLWLALSLASRAGQILTPPVNQNSGSGTPLDILSDTSPATDVTLPPQVTSTVAMPVVSLAPSSLDRPSPRRAVPALALELAPSVWASRLWLVWVVFPEGFPLAGLAEVQGAEVADGI